MIAVARRPLWTFHVHVHIHVHVSQPACQPPHKCPLMAALGIRYKLEITLLPAPDDRLAPSRPHWNWFVMIVWLARALADRPIALPSRRGRDCQVKAPREPPLPFGSGCQSSRRKSRDQFRHVAVAYGPTAERANSRPDSRPASISGTGRGRRRPFRSQPVCMCMCVYCLSQNCPPSCCVCLRFACCPSVRRVL
jgi:hypothetical protein